jgi:hypothetical protein
VEKQVTGSTEPVEFGNLETSFFFFVAAYRMDFIWFIDVYIKYIHTYIYIYNIWCILMNGFMRFDLVSYGLTIRFS